MKTCRKSRELLLALAAALLAGCGTHSQPVRPAAELTPEQQRFEAVWAASEDVLKRYDFPIVRRDRREGLLATGSVTGKQFFEFWRPGVHDLDRAAENSVQTIYQVAQVRIAPNPSAALGYTPTVDVDLFRGQQLMVQLTSTSHANAMFYTAGGINKLMLEDPLAPPPAGVVPLGDDANFAAQLAGEINTRAAKLYARRTGERVQPAAAPVPEPTPATPEPRPAHSTDQPVAEDGATIMQPVE